MVASLISPSVNAYPHCSLCIYAALAMSTAGEIRCLTNIKVADTFVYNSLFNAVKVVYFLKDIKLRA